MIWLKRNPYFYILLGLLLTVAMGGMFYASKDAERLAELKEQYEAKNTQLQLFLNRSPAPTKANLAVLDRNYQQLMEEFRKSQSSLNLSTYDPELFFGRPPSDSNDAFFMIAKYVEDARRLAVSSGVKTEEGMRFGFSQYENVGPSKDDIPRVHRQTKVMEALLQALFDSEISEFVSIKREAPRARDETSRNSGSSRKGQDFFNLEGTSSVRSAESFDSLAFQLEFKGQTSAMRGFLNRITGSSLPFAISEIEVQLDRESGSGEGTRRSIAENPFLNEDEADLSASAVKVPIISENESRFIVTLEFLELVDDSVMTEAVKPGKGSGNV